MSKCYSCPGCDNLISDNELQENNNKCIYCGLSFDDTEKLEELRKIYICPLCGDNYSNVDYRNISGKCKYCDVDLIKTDITEKEYLEIYDTDDIKSATRILANKYGDFQFSDAAYDRRMAIIQEERRQREALKNPPKPQITCPYCNSTNTKKISTASRAGSILGFGILSKKIGKQWHCNNCGSDF